MAGRLAGKVCLITGSTGMAAATIRLAVAEGARVFVVGKDEKTVTAASEHHYVADLTSTEETRAAVDECVRRLSRIDVLFHVAGISGRRFGDGPLHECTEQGWDVTLDVNLKSTYRIGNAVLSQMMNQPLGPSGHRGAILNMASISAYSPERKHFATHAYAASKAGIIGLSVAMAAYYAPHKIRVNVLAPGLVRTPMSLRAQSDPEIVAFMHEKQPLVEDLIDPEDVARAAIFLMSDEARAVTGAVFPVDAGWNVS